MKKFIVRYLEDGEELSFICMAEDSSHAKEQALDAYENITIISINEKE